jgi:hypothetical protein
MLRHVDDDIFRALDWELESAEDSDARELLAEALDHKVAGDLDAALDAVDRALLQAELEVVADDTVLAWALATRVAVLALLGRSEEALVVSNQLRELTKDGDGELTFLDGFARCFMAALPSATENKKPNRSSSFGAWLPSSLTAPIHPSAALRRSRMAS